VATYQSQTGSLVYRCVKNDLATSDPAVLVGGASLIGTGTAPSSICSNTQSASIAASTQSSLASVPVGSTAPVSTAVGHCSLLLLAVQSAPTANSDGSTTATVYVNIFACPLITGPDATELAFLCNLIPPVIETYAPSLKVAATTCSLIPSTGATGAKKRAIEQTTSYPYQTSLSVSPNSSASSAIVVSLISMVAFLFALLLL